MDLFKYYAISRDNISDWCAHALLSVISAETHLQSLLCLGPCIIMISANTMLSHFSLMRCFPHFGWCDIIDNFCTIAEIRWPDVIGHLYTSGLAMLSEILTEWLKPTDPDMQACIGRFADPRLPLPPRKSILVLLRTQKWPIRNRDHTPLHHFLPNNVRNDILN